MKFHREQKWLSSRSTNLFYRYLFYPAFLHLSLLSDGEPIELDRLLDREGGFSPKLGMSLSPPLSLSPLQTWPTFILLFSLPADRISRYFQLSRCLPRNLRSEDRGNCLEVALDLSLGNQKHRHGGGRATKILSLVNSSTSTLYISCSLERIGSETVRVAIRSGLLCIYFRIL